MVTNPLKTYPHITICFKIPEKEAFLEAEDNITEHINYEDYIDKWIIGLWNSGHEQDIQKKYSEAKKHWETCCLCFIENLPLQTIREKSLEKFVEKLEEVSKKDYKMFRFKFVYNRVVYYGKLPNEQHKIVSAVIKEMSFSLPELLKINDRLKEINYAMTRSEWWAQSISTKS